MNRGFQQGFSSKPAPTRPARRPGPYTLKGHPDWPKSGFELHELEYQSARDQETGKVRKQRCECGSEFFFARREPQGEAPGKWTPMAEVAPPQWAEEGQRYFQPHFLNCPNADKFRRRERKR